MVAGCINKKGIKNMDRKSDKLFDSIDNYIKDKVTVT